ncbi:S-layer homology domain-containing protein [Sedimentibacter sp. LTW-03]|uniref:S-layer homology domain-containing protein n=1 Tax=Sedimentibacter sp. LTW-03 TaxID=3453406 RepID=UPI003F86B3D1
MKKSFDRLIALILLVFMLFPTMTSYNAYAASPFPDMVGHWAERYVNDLYYAGVVIGDQNGNFRPDEYITVGDAATMLDKYYFNGFDRDDTYPIYWDGHLEMLDQMGVLSPSDYDSVSSNLTRLVAVLLVINSIDDPDMTGMNVPTKFTDDGAIDPKYKKHVNFATENGVLDGYEDGSFMPRKPITRAELAKILFTVKDDYRLKEEGSGGLEPEVHANLEMDLPNYVTWNYKQFENGNSVELDVDLDASGSTSNLPVENYNYKILVDGNKVVDMDRSRDTYGTYVEVSPDDIRSDRVKITASVTVEDETGLTDMAIVDDYVEAEVINEPPEAYFTHSNNNYVTLPVTLTNQSSDPEDDMAHVSWTIKNDKKELIFYSDTDLNSGDTEQDYTQSYFSSVNFNEDGGKLIFTEEGYYTVEIHVIDNGCGYGQEEDSYSKKIYVNFEPQPPTADFNMYEFGYPNESVPIKDKSTDPNNDIVTWTWTKPTINKDDGTPAAVSGNLSGKNGGSLTFSKEGTYDVSLSVKDYTNLTDSITKYIKIIPPVPVARITAEGAIKKNRKVTLHMRDSLSPRTDQIQTSRNIWKITPLDGQNPASIKIDLDTSNLEEKNIVFKETGRYEVYLKVHNNFSDANPLHPNIAASEITEIITVTEDLEPISEFTVGGATPNFTDNPLKTTVDIRQNARSIDDDIISKYKYVIYRDIDEDGDFSDEAVYGTYDVGDTATEVFFQQGVSGAFKADLEVTEEFGQPTIEKFVTVADRRKHLSSQTFHVNWIPDISFDLPEWAYTDDTLNISTLLKDEEISTLDVAWTIKRADETDTSVMNDDDISARTDNALNNNGGIIRFKDSGYYTLTATVTDEIGQNYSYSEDIRVYPLPTAIIKDAMHFREVFQTKENRKYQLNGNSSYANDYYSAELHSIDHSKDYWEIVPLDGQNADVIKVANGTGSLPNDIVSTLKYQKSNNEFEEDLLFKLKGKYMVRYQVTNSYGKKSPMAEQIITVAEDTAPIISFDVIEKTYRDVDDSKRAELVTYNISSVSDDHDVITQALHTLKYRFDSDNDGNFNDETWKSPLSIDFTNKKATVKASHVGKYQFQLYVKDTYGQDTISQFISSSDIRYSIVTKTIEIDNMAPTIDFSVTPSNKVDIVFTVGQVESSKINELSAKINNYVKAYLEANNADYIDTEIETIETSTISSNDADAAAVFNNWTRYGTNSNTWSYNSSKGIISRDDNSYWSGFYDPTFDSSNYTFEVELGTSGGDNDDIGVSFGIDGTPTGHLAFLISQQGLVWKGDSYTTKVHGHPSGLYQYNGSKIKGVSRPTADVSYVRNSWHSLKAVVKGKNIKIWWDNVQVIDYTHTSEIKGSFGFFTNSQPEGRFRNLTVTSGSVKTLDEVLKEPTWRSDSTKFVINISDVNLPELEKTSDKYSVVLSRMLNDELYFAEFGTSTNKSQTENFIKDNDNKGTFIYNNSPNMDKALQNLAVWILNVVRNQARPMTRYILLNEEVNYKTFYEDYEDDPQNSSENWRYVHDYDYFTNDLGIASYSGLWLSAPKTSFDKVGLFTTEVQTKDNPVGTETRFDEYKKTSTMKNGALNIYVHRKPIAQFSPTITPIKAVTTAYHTESEIDFSGEGDTYAQWTPSYTAPSGSTIVSIEFKTPRADDDYWYNEGELYIEGYKNGTWTELKNYDSKSRTSDPIQDTINVAGQGYTQVRAYFRMRDSSDSARGNPGDSFFKVGYTSVDTSGFNISFMDTSYDLDHMNRGDKGLVAWEWYWKKVGDASWTPGILTGGVSTKDYLVKLRVRDMDGENKLGAWSDDTVVLITSKAMPPIAQFVLSHSLIAQGATLGITDTSYDPNGDDIDKWEWKLYKEGALLGTYTAANSQTSINNKIKNSGIGDFRITLQVNDTSGSWGDPLATSEIYTQNFKVAPVNHVPSADFNLVSGESPVWTFPKIVGDRIYKYRPSSGFFHEEMTKFNVSASDTNTDNLGFTYEWTFENYKASDISGINGNPSSVVHYASKQPFANSFKNQGLDWGAYKITLKVTDNPPIPPYGINSQLSVYVTKNFYIIPDISIAGDFESENSEILVGDTIKVKATTNREVTGVAATLDSATVNLIKSSTSGETVYWEGNITIPDTIIESGKYNINFKAQTNYGGKGNVTREATTSVPINIIALKLIDFRITNIVNHPYITFPYTKDMLISKMIPYKTGYYVTFQIDSKGSPDSVAANIYLENILKETVNLTKVSSSAGTETWEGKFYTNAREHEDNIIKIFLWGKKGSIVYDYNDKESWNGRSLIIKGSAFQDGRVNLTN